MSAVTTNHFATPRARVLLVSYSMTGHTRALAEELRSALRADAEELIELRPRRGLIGVLRALYDTLRRRRTEIAPPMHKVKNYEILVLGGPIWGGRMAAPIRTFAWLFGKDAAMVALFCTEGGRGSESAFAELLPCFRAAPLATLTVDARHLPPSAHSDQLQHFVSTIKSALAAI